MDLSEFEILDEISPTKHVLERTSPKGEKFFGRCVRCGLANLPATAARDICNEGQANGSH